MLGWNIHVLLVRLINIFLAVVVFFLGMRLVLRLVTANEATPFVAWIYSVSEYFITPFRGIVENPTVTGGSILDVVALIAIVAYMLLAYLVIALMNAIARSFMNRDRYMSQTHSHV